MSSLVVVCIAGVLFFLAYRFYAKKLEGLWQINPQRPTPAVSKYNGVDFVPAKNWLVLFGHHFSSIAGAGPIIGPVIAVVYWGWLPALIWVILGAIFIGGTHDFSSLIVSVREEANSVANISSKVVSKNAKIIFSLFIWLALILVISVFIHLCADTFVKEPRIVLPSLGLIPTALFVGFLLYNLKANSFLTTILGLLVLACLIILGNLIPISLGKDSLIIWSFILILYSYIASITPVQILLQPRDYLSSFLLFFGAGAGLIGLLISNPKLSYSFYTHWRTEAGILWPMLCVTVACGAISGFHSLISSGTTSKQLSSERYAKRIGYGGMLIEGLVAILAILAISAGIKGDLLSIFKQTGPIATFGRGYGEITAPLLRGFGSFIAITILNSFILTTLDTATRIARYITEELFKIKNRYLSTLIIVISGGALALSGRWSRIWPVFGAANQLTASLALFVVTCWLLLNKKKTLFTLIPAVFMLFVTVSALIYQSLSYFKNKDYLLLGISGVLVGLALFMLIEVILKFKDWAQNAKR